MTDAVYRQLTSGGSFFWRWAPARLDEAEMMWIIFCKLPPLRWRGNVANIATCFAKKHIPATPVQPALRWRACVRLSKPWPGQTRTWKVFDRQQRRHVEVTVGVVCCLIRWDVWARLRLIPVVGDVKGWRIVSLRQAHLGRDLLVKHPF